LAVIREHKMKRSKSRRVIGQTTKKRKRVQTVDYDEFLLKQLKDLDYAAGYLTACLEEGEDVFYLGIRQVAKATGGMKSLSEATQLNRESLYDMISKSGNPLFSNVTSILDKLGIELKFTPKMHGSKAA
jgi:probable addiction module antidote protein